MEGKENMRTYCYECDSEEEFEILEETIEMNIKGVKFPFTGNVAYCKKCGNEVNIGKLSDENVRRANEAYRKKIGIIQVKEIEELLDKYNIGQKPLAKLLGWGEVTIIRYLQGVMPTKEYSEKLKDLFNPYKMKELLEKRKEEITPIAKKKLEACITELIESNSKKGEKIRPVDVGNFFLSRMDVEAGESITPLKLQKLLYYAQSWMLGFFGEVMFDDEFIAWQHGPVLPEIYYRYKPLGYDSIPKVNSFHEDIFGEKELSILEMVWKVYGKYDGKFLELLTHSEDPWRVLWNNKEENSKRNDVIPKNVIKEYYIGIKEKLKISNTTETVKLDKYINKLIFN